MGSTMAQDAPFVIKKDNHYLAHVKVGDTWVLQDATVFDPETCLWYSGTEFNSSGTNHNYYFKEVFENGTTNYHFLSAPLEANGTLSYSSTTPYTYLLRNREGIYYFYDWDADAYGRGVARGIQHTGVSSQSDCQYSWGDNQCWEVYWVECTGNATDGYTWQLSPSSSYHITNDAARFRQVTVNETVEALNNSGLRALNADGTAVSSIVMDYSGDRDRALSATIVTPYKFKTTTTYAFENLEYEIIKDDYSVGLLSSPYHWTISGEGKDYLSFASGSRVLTSHEAAPTLYYRTENYSGDKTATLTLTVSYQYGYTQTLSVPVTLQTSCQNPRLAASPVITSTGVTVSWYNTNATAYKLWWKKETDSEWASIDKGTETSHTFSVTGSASTGLEYETTYQYWISAKCGDDYLPLLDGTDPFEFTTKPEPNLIIHGDLYGGGRMANVTGNPEIVIINCDNISSVYGGNDIAGAVQGANGTKIQIGVNSGDANYASLGVTQDTITIGSVYGGGNGYYAYNGTSFTAASNDYNSQSVAANGHVNAMTQNNQVGDAVWTNDATEAVTLNFPTIIKTEIKVANDYVKVDSLFGGAKNAFLTLDDEDANGSSITIDGGTLFAVFGGNNIGGTVGTAKHHIVVNQTKTKMALGVHSTATTGTGRDFGIRYLFGGGNKVPGSTTDIVITGGQMDTIFGGGNLASVTASFMEVACTAGASSGDYTFGKVYSNAIASYTDGKFVMKESGYDWDGNGIYNVHTLFGGNNKAPMNGVPHITLTSGSVGTAYGGGNAGDMTAHLDGSITTFKNHQESKILNFKYGTKIEMTHPNMVVDYLYGGCQVSNVDYSTWVEITDGNIGSVYGGCNVSGDVGSTRTNLSVSGPSGLQYQEVKGGTYVRATGGTVYRDFFAGSNGFYHCNNGTRYTAGVDYGDPEQHYIGMLVPSHNETHLFIGGDVTIKGDAYTGGNLACVGFTNFTVPYVNNGSLPYPQFVGLSSLHMDGGTVEGSVYGGGRMASVYGSNEVKVDGGTIGGALYGGNDRTGQVAQITNRVWPDNEYSVASDGYTSLSTVNTYVGITGTPNINTVYGGGNGAYVYEGEEADMEYCLLNDQPIQSNTFVDIHLEDAGRINTVFGGGNGVTVTGEITVFLNVNVTSPNNYASPDQNHVGTIFGGNNLGSLDILSNIILLRGKVGTVYGGCNEGAMVGSKTLASYTNVGSYVRLLNEYPDGANSTMTPFAEVTGAVYGGCRMNGVTNNSLVLVEGGNHPNADIYGGSDISGDVAGISQVVVTSGTHNNGPVIANAFGGGNGDYDYTSGSQYENLNPPYCADSRVIMLGGTAGNLFAGGNDGECGITQMQVEGGTVTGRVFGGGNMAGVVKSHDLTVTSVDEYGNPTNHTNSNNTAGTSTVNMIGGQVNGGIFGGNNLSGTIGGPVNVNIYGGTLGTSTTAMADGIFGGGYGAESKTDDNVTVTIGDETHTPTIYGNVYGGSALGQVNTNTDNLTLVDFKDGTLHGNLFGGGMGQLLDETDPDNIIPAVSALVKGNAKVAISDGTLLGNIYGGCNLNGNVKGNILVDLTGGSVGANNTATADVFGGGYGNLTVTEGNVEVKLNGASAYVYGDIYGGSGYGDVNKDNTNTTTVNILNGYVKKTTIDRTATVYGGNVYGGGLGRNQIGDDPNTAYPAKINGKVYVNIGSGEVDGDGFATSVSGNATIEGDVYGCNNVNGSPQDDVFVNIYQTAHGDTDATNAYPSDIANAYSDGSAITVTDLEYNIKPTGEGGQGQTFALNAVYGGGNKASYLPAANKMTTVHVYGCGNTIKDVYGGGNAADVGKENELTVNTLLRIDGGRIYRSFGGGNGAGTDNPGANIYGTASSQVYAGLINEVYGGANQLGSIDVIDLNVTSANTCDEVYGKVFGCANAAPLNHSITTTIGCPVGTIGELYGGSFQAPIGEANNPNANVTLNVYGGSYASVFGGSKGKDDIAANIYGNVTLNLFGGTITDAFGGNDVNGTISGVVTVNVLDHESGCPLDITNIYGANRLAAYEPSDPASVSPVVNVMHVKSDNEIHGNVYGGAYGASATVTSNPQVNIGYDATTMQTLYNSLLPDPAPANYMGSTGVPSAHVHGNVYGGGELASVVGTSTVNLLHQNASANQLYGGGHRAGTTNTVVNVYNGAVVPATNNNVVTDPAVYGGCDEEGTITGNIAVNVLNNLGVTGTDGYNVNVFGGGRGVSTSSGGNVIVTIGGENYTPNILGNVYGGSALGSVSAATKLTKVELKSGTVTGDVYGGGLGVVDNPATPEEDGVEAHVNGDIQVVGNGGNVTGWVFGANDQNGAPAGEVEVIINGGTIDNVAGGGDVADYTSPVVNNNPTNYPSISITGGTVTHKVVGGGNNAHVTGNPTIVVSGGTIGTSTESDAGIYGGCNTTGTVTGNTNVTLTGGTVGAVMNPGQSNQYYTGHIHGGGYGSGTNVTGNVVVNFGAVQTDNSGVESHTTTPVLYGDVYGGSALGHVNTGYATNSNLRTTVNLLNGTIHGAAYGGGLGSSEQAALVYGEVHVNVGNTTNNNIYDEDSFVGMADLSGCDVYGGNNIKGTPKQSIYVDVYKTYHTNSNVVSGTDYAIHEVIGGGNHADYSPEGTNKKTNVFIHMCDNTVRRVFGGGNAAAAPGVNLTINGGRYLYVFGGGNGEVTAANIGTGGINMLLGGGNITYLFNGSNNSGTVQGSIVSETDQVCSESEVEYYFLGNNSINQYGDINTTIYCGEGNDVEMRFVNLYCGSNTAQIYGNINVTIEGGVFDNVFGGSRGSADPNSPVAANINIITQAIVDDDHPELANRVGDGGNVNLTIKGGTIGNLYGGCDANGNVQGAINIEVYSDEGTACPLFIGNIYGAGNRTNYTPLATNIQNGSVYSPKIKIINGTIGGTSPDLPVKLTNPSTFKGNVFGGGNIGNVTGSPKVIVGNGTTSSNLSVDIKGNVFGGGNEGDVTGNPVVVVIPDVKNTLSYEHVEPNTTDSCVVRVTNSLGHNFASGSTLGEDLDVRIQGIASVYGYKFVNWERVSGDGIIAYNNSASTLFTMKKQNSLIRANFAAATVKNFKYEVSGSGVARIYDGKGNIVPSDRDISEGAVLSIKAIASPNGSRFTRWEVVEPTVNSGTIADVNKDSTTFTMGTVATKIRAVFGEVTTHYLTITPSAGGTFTVKDALNQTVSTGASIGEGTVLTLAATPTPSSDYVFERWTVTGAGSSVGNATSANTTFTMGTANAEIKAVFVKKHTFTYNCTPADGGVVRITNQATGATVNSNDLVAEGAVLNIVAIPSIYGHQFTSWSVEGTGASVDDATSATTTFTMGTADATLTATFGTATTHSLTVTQPANNAGYFTVKDATGQSFNGDPINVGTVLNLVLIPSVYGFHFNGWVVTGEGSSVANTTSTTTTFTMGTANATLTAGFETVDTHTLTVTQGEHGSFTVKDGMGQNLNSNQIGEGAVLNLVAIPAEGYRFQSWVVTNENGELTHSTVGDLNSATTTFTMGASNATITATFVQQSRGRHGRR